MNSTTASNILGVIFLVIAAAAYVVPSVVAVARKMPNAGAVIVIDLLLGWTVVGWIVALAMACGSNRRYPAPPPQWQPPAGPPPGWQGPPR